MQLHYKRLPEMAIVLFDGAWVSSLGAFTDIGQATKSYVTDLYGVVDSLPERTFDCMKIVFLGATSRTVKTAGGWTWAAENIVGDDHVYDAIVLAGFEVDQNFGANTEMLSDRRLRCWLQRQYDAGAQIAAAGAASFLLAETGLLNGRRATTSWWLRGRFGERFPAVRLDIENAVTEDGRISCSSGMAFDHALALKIVEKLFSENVALYISRMLAVDRKPVSAAPTPVPDQISDDPLVSRAQHWLQQRYPQPVRINQLADAMAVSRRTLVRRFSKSLGVTPIGYLHKLRLSASKTMIERSFRIDRIATLVGYSDVNYLKRLFEREVGVPLKDYRTSGRKEQM